MKALILSVFILIFSQVSYGKNLIIGVENIDYHPISSIKSGEYAGYARELLDHFAKEYNHNITYRPLPIVRLFHELVEDEIDLKFPDNPNWASDFKQGTDITYSQSALSYTDGIMVSADKLGQTKLKTLGIVRGFTPYAVINEVNQGAIKVKEFNNIKTLISIFLNRGDVEGVYFNVAIASYTMRSLGIDDEIIAFDSSLPHINGDYFLSTVKHTDIIKEFDEFLERNSSFVEKLKEKYGLN
ncbi:substrate-binding periplasmic protein [Vibrio aquimaris]|uniref:Bacterial extracellular solute-binding protein, family 3 n=1 Tax=Vibrio aquimaris TaxID=2587862 RepID=A0A5P9CPU3_9VIBR|nr:transporter substrate-binding domain-containing protein [Vibrio aquimaris]QFT28275.1 Bacterial extracellular solute-binding protein, family 3 [Vibrio aquimaris]